MNVSKLLFIHNCPLILRQQLSSDRLLHHETVATFHPPSAGNLASLAIRSDEYDTILEEIIASFAQYESKRRSQIDNEGKVMHKLHTFADKDDAAINNTNDADLKATIQGMAGYKDGLMGIGKDD